MVDSKGNLATFDPKDDLAFLPEAIINSRINSNGDPEVLVKWEKHNLEEATKLLQLVSLLSSFPSCSQGSAIRPSVAKNNKRTVKSARHEAGFAYAGKKKEIDDSRSREREERRRERRTKTIQSVT
ncbi:ty3-gypsy retrotransposon protein [Tanacetum coccineum]